MTLWTEMISSWVGWRVHLHGICRFLCAKTSVNDDFDRHTPHSSCCGANKKALKKIRSATKRSIQIVKLNMHRRKTVDNLLSRLLSTWPRRKVWSLFCWTSITGTSLVLRPFSHCGDLYTALDPGNVPVLGTGSRNGFVWVKCRGLTFFSCYFTLNQPIEDYC